MKIIDNVYAGRVTIHFNGGFVALSNPTAFVAQGRLAWGDLARMAGRNNHEVMAEVVSLLRSLVDDGAVEYERQLVDFGSVTFPPEG